MYLVPNFSDCTYKFFVSYEDAEKYRTENWEVLSRCNNYNVEIIELKDGETPMLIQNGAWSI